MIRGFIETSLIDWDGKIAAVLFFDRCNFLCPFCQNWELILHPDRFPQIPWDDILKKLLKKKKWVDGVVFTGGEPLIYFKDIMKFMHQLKAAGFGVKIDTHGGFPKKLKELITAKMVDYIAMDIKAPLDDSYLAAIGKTASSDKSIIDQILTSIDIIKNSDVEHEFRTTCVPGIIDEVAVEKIGNKIQGAKKWFLQAFVPEHAYKPEYRTTKFSPVELCSLLEAAKKSVHNAALRGQTG